MNIEAALNLEDIRELARRKLPKIAFDFIDGGVDDEHCLRRNRDAFSQYNLVPRYLIDVSRRDQSVDLLGHRYDSPIGISPTGLAGLFRPDADCLLAQAAVDHNIPYLMSSASNHSIETATRIAPDHVWFQIYCTPEERINLDLIRRAREANVKTLVVSVDVPVNANRERNRRNGFTRPFKMTPWMALEALTHPGWLLDYLRSGGIPVMQNWAPYAPEGATADQVADVFGRLTPNPMTNWKILEKIRSLWRGNLVVKGILHPEDARLVVETGADAIIVSNHGGRQLDTAPSPIDMLPSIRAVAPNIPIMVDSGVRRGSDIVIAMCLGARFAFFGRPTLYGAAAAGRRGIGKTIGLVRAEIDLVMAQIGCTRLDALHAGYLRRAGADYTALANVGQNPGPDA